ANKDLDYGHLIRDPRGHSGKVIAVEGTLRRLTREEAPRDLQEKGVHQLYQGFIDLDEKDTNPVCVIFPELPEGLQVGNNLKVRVRFAGYFFKRYLIEVEGKEHKTLLLIGPTVKVLSGPPSEGLESLGAKLGGPLLSAILGLMVGTLLFI